MRRLCSNSGERGDGLWVMLGVIASLIAIFIAGFGVYTWQQQKVSERDATISSLNKQLQQAKTQPPSAPGMSSYTSTKGVHLLLYKPARSAKVTSPIAVIGEVPGNWSFEASFPVELKDAAGRTVAQTQAHLLGDWMTDQLVPFSASLPYAGTPSGSGTVVLDKDNPSGLPQNDDQVAVAVQF